MHLIDSYEDSTMPRTHRAGTTVVVDRGRIAREPTNVHSDVEGHQIDQAQELTDQDLYDLSRENVPPEETQEHIAARIAELRRLKYGRK